MLGLSYITWLVIIFVVLCALVLFVYVAVVWGYYWSGRKENPAKKEKPRE
jgi:YbbR domain-containing protein